MDPFVLVLGGVIIYPIINKKERQCWLIMKLRLRGILNNPMLLGTTLFAFYTVINTSQFGPSLSWIIIPSLIILFFGVSNRYIQTKRVLIFFFWAAYTLSTIASKYVPVERNLITFFILCLVYIFSVSYKYDERHVRFLINVIIAISSYASLNIFYNWITHNYYNVWFQRASMTVGNVYRDPNYVMAFIVPALYFNLLKIISSKGMKRLFIIAIEALMLTTFFTTGSRGPIVSFALAVVILFLWKSKIPIQRKFAYIFIAVCSVFALLFLENKYLPTQALERLFNSKGDSRTKLWTASLNVFKSNPILGGGFGSASQQSLIMCGNYSHNVYLDILCDSGLLGTTIFLLFFFMNCMPKYCVLDANMLGSVVAFMAPLFFINGFNTATFYFPLIMLSILSNYINENGNLVNLFI